jgi:hypothetical protein
MEFPPESGVAAALPPSRFVVRSKPGCSAAESLPANGAEQNGYRVRTWTEGQRAGLVERLAGHSGIREVKSRDDRHRSWRGRGLGMHQNRGCTTVKCCVRQIDVGQHYDQQHEKDHADEDAHRRRSNVPLLHNSPGPLSNAALHTLFARAGARCQWHSVPKMTLFSESGRGAVCFGGKFRWRVRCVGRMAGAIFSHIYASVARSLHQKLDAIDLIEDLAG